jgi:hypothetical protein
MKPEVCCWQVHVLVFGRLIILVAQVAPVRSVSISVKPASAKSNQTSTSLA